jgi:hypothetical protein
MWYAVPTGAIHAFYVGTTERIRIDSEGSLISTAGIRGLGLVAGGTSYQLLIGPPSATSAATIQTIQQGVGYNQNLTLQNAGGNVGIGTTNPVLTLHVGSTNANHNIGRAILTAGNIHNADKRDFLSIGRWDGSSTADMEFTGIRYGVITGVDSGEVADNHSCITFHTWGNNISNSREVMRINSRGILSIKGNIIASGTGTSSIANNLNISGATTQAQSLFFRSDNYNLGVAGAAGNFSSSAAANDMILRTVANTRLILQSGSGGAGLIIDSANNTTLNSLTLTNAIYLKTNTWNYSTDNLNRFYFANSGPTYYKGHEPEFYSPTHIWYSNNDSTIMKLTNSGHLYITGQMNCLIYTIANTNRDLCGIAFENTATNSGRLATIHAIQGTFTGFHRVFTEDELFNKEEPQLFKDTYEGRIVVSTGKIATDTCPNDKDWIIEYDKAGITIEDALPKIELSRKKKDKRVFGVLGDRRRSNSRPERLIINSVGEGALWVCNSNGNIENGDYITSSDYLGYGEKQDEIFLCNYTVAKATMDCNFELDSPLYNCIELENNLRVAFIAVSYHCG